MIFVLCLVVVVRYIRPLVSKYLVSKLGTQFVKVSHAERILPLMSPNIGLSDSQTKKTVNESITPQHLSFRAQLQNYSRGIPKQGTTNRRQDDVANENKESFSITATQHPTNDSSRKGKWKDLRECG